MLPIIVFIVFTKCTIIYMFDSTLINKYPVALKFLELALRKGKLANSYVFIGNNDCDLKSVIVNLAKSLNCKSSKDNTPCNTCTNCRWLNEETHPQALITIEPDSESKKEVIKIEGIRNLLEKLNISSEYFRIIFFKKANINTLPSECCNLLLKAVEESPNRTIFIFSNNIKSEILPTIVSRSQTIYLNSNEQSLITNINDLPEMHDFNSEKDIFEKAKKTIKTLEEKEVELKMFLLQSLLYDYKNLSKENLKPFIERYNHFSRAYQKNNAFIQQKIVLEDLILSTN